MMLKTNIRQEGKAKSATRMPKKTREKYRKHKQKQQQQKDKWNQQQQKEQKRTK